MAAWQTTSITITTLLLSVALVTFQVAGARDNMPMVSNLVEKACKNMSSDILSRRAPRFDEKPCVSVLRSDKRTVSAKDHGDLVVIAMDLLEKRSKEIAVKIESVLRDLKVHNRTEYAFQFCAADYAAMLRTLPACRNMFLGIKPLGKKVAMDDAMGALGCVDKLGIAARDCGLELDNDWSGTKTDEYYSVIRYISLVWGLMEMATDRLDYWYDW
ncbi:hypothetical protein ACP70R_047178 [Stipagrostis hirtigluma subsp. patula]